jgi:FkbM family methyltransferase
MRLDMYLLNTIQGFTSRVQLKRMPWLLWKLFSSGRICAQVGHIYPAYNNLELKIDPTVNFHWLNVVNYGGYEAVLLFERFLKPGDVYLDIGANYGYMSINAAKIVGPAGRVIAVEPEPRAGELLKFNARLNDARIEIVPKAISDVPGTANFNVATEMGLSRLDNARKNTSGMILQENVTIQKTTVDLLISEMIPDRDITLLKMDVEGHEMRILQGAAALVARQKTMFMLEVNFGALAQNDLSFKDIFEFFATRGYDVFWIHSHAADWFRLGRQPTLEKVKDYANYLNRNADILVIPKSMNGEAGQ